MPSRLVAAVAAFFAALLLAAPASAGRYCTGACDGYVVTPPPVVHLHPRRARHGHVVVHRYWKPEPRDARVHVLREPKVRRHRVKRRHVRRTHARRAHASRASVRGATPRRLYAPNTHMRGRTRFCSDRVERAGHVTFRRCVQVRDDLLGRH